jgi:hypothetical protein
MAPHSGGFETVWGVSRLSRGWLEWELQDGSNGKAKADAFGFTPQGADVLRVRLDGMKAHSQGRVRSHTFAVDDGEKIHQSLENLSNSQFQGQYSLCDVE